MNKTTSWGNVAEWYADHTSGDDTYHSKVILPNLIRIMNIRPSDRILDLACGSGFFATAFAAAGATVMASDISAELVGLARQRTDPKIEYHVAPAHDMSFAANNSIDKISLVLAIQNIENVKDVFSECERVLKQTGKLCIVMNHPAFRIPKSSSWGWDGEDMTQYRRVDSYLSEKKVMIEMHPGKNSKKTVSFHRPLQYYFKFLQSAGFVVKRLEEWISHRTSEPGPRRKEEDRMRKEIPLFLFLEAQKG